MRGALVPFLAHCALLACSPSPPGDAGTGDGGSGERDAGASDAGAHDDDAGPSRDGGTPVDAAVIEDAAALDGSVATQEDSGALDDDAGDTLDAGGGLPDGGTAVCDPEATPNAGIVEPEGSAGCPPGTVLVAGEGFCVDRFEAFLVEVTDGGEVPWSPYQNPGARRVRAKSAQGAVPQAYINQVQAAAACLEAGKRLCNDDEWLRACRGPDMTTYPYGDTRVDGACNDERATHPAIELYGGDNPFSHLDDPCLDQLPDSLDEAGANEACLSSDGAFDMMGNLHEWTADPAGTFRGGFFVDTSINGEGCLYSTTAHATPYWDYSTGFRCCADP